MTKKTVADYHGEICDGLKKLYAEKNADYGDSFAGARKEVPYYTLGKLYDKFNRIKTLMLNSEEHQVNDEAVEDTLRDLANYAIMELAERKAENDGRKSEDKTEENDVPKANEDIPDVIEHYLNSDGDNGIKHMYNMYKKQTATYERTEYLINKDGRLSGFRFVIETSPEWFYVMQIYYDKTYEDDEDFMLAGMEKLMHALREYVEQEEGSDANHYVIKWDDVINPTCVCGESIAELYERFAYYVYSLKHYREYGLT